MKTQSVLIKERPNRQQSLNLFPQAFQTLSANALKATKNYLGKNMFTLFPQIKTNTCLDRKGANNPNIETNQAQD